MSYQAGPHSYPYQAPPPRKRSRTTRTVLIVVAVVLLLCCVGGGVGGYFVYRSAKGALQPARDATSRYLDTLRAGDYQGAYGQLCATERAAISAEEFTRTQSTQPKIVSYSFTGLSVNTTNGRTSGEATVRLSRESAGSITQVFRLVKENGQWRVCG